MDTSSTPNAVPAQAEAVITDLFRLELADGLPVESQGRTIRYRVVCLRETCVAHERKAVQQAERVMMIGGAPRLLVSDADFRYALTVQHIEAFECDGNRIPEALIDLALAGKLSAHDFERIEARVLLIGLAAEVRYGNLTQSEFDAVAAGKAQGVITSPQPVGQTADVGADRAPAESGPAMLADFAGSPASGAPAGAGH